MRLNFGIAVLAEATPPFLGRGTPIRTGDAGFWQAVLFPALQFCLIMPSVNGVADGLRAALNPRLR